jgi:hypothetical protein
MKEEPKAVASVPRRSGLEKEPGQSVSLLIWNVRSFLEQSQDEDDPAFKIASLTLALSRVCDVLERLEEVATINAEADKKAAEATVKRLQGKE